MESIAIASEYATAAVGPHSQGVRRGNILAVGGQVGADPKSGILCEGVHDQLRQAMTNLQAVLTEAGASFADVVLLHVYLTEEGHFREMNAVLDEFLSEPFPARTTIYVGLPPDMLVEIDALAVVE
jgi:2-iminobutanoate/2-iminopropanoate deaminase